MPDLLLHQVARAGERFVELDAHFLLGAELPVDGARVGVVTGAHVTDDGHVLWAEVTVR